jgi:2-haloacid dehalogenase
VVFDLGGVLIDWNPRYLYRKLLPDPDQVEHFLSHVCTSDWNADMDRGRPWPEAVAELSSHYPEHRDLIEAFDVRWQEMVAGPIVANVAVLSELVARHVDVVALTNWSAVKLRELAQLPDFAFLAEFREIVISSDVGKNKPHPHIYAVAEQAYGRPPQRLVLIDDSRPNVLSARRRGWDAIWFQSTHGLRAGLAERHLLTEGSNQPGVANEAHAEGRR